MNNKFSEAVKTCIERVEAAKGEIAKKIIGKFDPKEVEAIEQKNPNDNFHSVGTYWHIPSKTKLASIEIKFKGTRVDIETWINSEVL